MPCSASLQISRISSIRLCTFIPKYYIPLMTILPIPIFIAMLPFFCGGTMVFNASNHVTKDGQPSGFKSSRFSISRTPMPLAPTIRRSCCPNGPNTGVCQFFNFVVLKNGPGKYLRRI